jgi:hypothetical protein
MNVGTEHPVVATYLAQLDVAAAAAGLSGGRRAELQAEIRAHVDDALAGASPTDATVADVLDRLGPVEDIVAAEGGTPVASRPAAVPAGAGPGGGPWGPGREAGRDRARAARPAPHAARIPGSGR